MVWYTDSKQQLDRSRPIFASPRIGTDELILLPQMEPNMNYRIIGYNWFSIKSGEYNSCVCYESIDAAILSYTGSYDFYNGSITVKAD